MHAIRQSLKIHPKGVATLPREMQIPEN